MPDEVYCHTLMPLQEFYYLHTTGPFILFLHKVEPLQLDFHDEYFIH